MKQQKQHDDPLMGALRQGLKQHAGQAAGAGCPPADLLAGYFERTLPANESARWEVHFSSCARCQEQLAALAQMETVVGGSQRANPLPGFSFLNWRWLTAAGAATAGALAIWFVVQTGPSDTGFVASNRQAATASAPAKTPPQASAESTAPQGKVADAGGARAAESVVSDNRKLPAAAKPALDANAPAFAARQQGLTRETEGTKTKPAATEELLAQQRVDEKKDALLAERDAGEKREAAASADRVESAKLADAQKANALAGSSVAGRAELKKQVVADALPPVPSPAQTPAQTQAQIPAEQKEQSAAAQLAPGVVANKARTRNPATDYAQEVPRRTKEAPGADTGRPPAPPRPEFSTLAGRVQWRFFKGGVIFRYDERLKGGEESQSPVPEELLAASAPSEKACWAVGRGGVVIRTMNMEAWRKIGSPTDEDLVFVEAQDALRATVRTSSGKTYVTTDGGRTWRTK